MALKRLAPKVLRMPDPVFFCATSIGIRSVTRFFYGCITTFFILHSHSETALFEICPENAGNIHEYSTCYFPGFCNFKIPVPEYSPINGFLFQIVTDF
jgi:hypothetical protein